MELRIPLPASSNCSEDGKDGQTSAGTDNCFQAQGLKESEESLSQEALSTPDRLVNDEDIDQGLKETGSQASYISLDELARLIELERYESHQSLSVQNNLHQLYFSAGLDRRLGRVASLTYRKMVGSYKASNQAGFVAKYHAYENLYTEWHAVRGAPPLGSRFTGGEELFATSWDTDTSSWIRTLSTASQKDILTFLVNIRTKDGFLSDCISGLSPTELTALTSLYQPVALAGSVLQNHSHAKVREEGHGYRSGTLVPGLDALRNFHRNDPYFLLLHGVFDDSSKPRSSESRLRCDIWSTTCARVLMDGKRGSDEFAVTTLDAFAGFQEWALVPQLEAFLMKNLHEGAFLLDPPPPTDFKQPVEIRNAQTAIAGSHFFDTALKTLFQLLANGPLEAGVPESALDFAHATLRKIEDPRIRLKAKTFIISRWYFQCFLSNILVYPESQGILMEHHVGETARRMILQELANRIQKVVADVLSPWNHTTIVTPEVQAFVARILQLFEPPTLASCRPELRENHTGSYLSNLMLCSEDVSCLIEFFYPELSSSLPTNISDGSAPSTASSVAGSSTLMASSVTPSSNGTSIITHEFNHEDLMATQPKEKIVSSPLPKVGFKIPLPETPFEGRSLKDIYDKLKEKSPSEVLNGQGRSNNDWAIIYTSPDRTRLSIEPGCFDEMPPKPRSQLALRNDSKDTGILTNALIRLLMDRSNFDALALRLGIESTDFTKNWSILMRLFDFNTANCRAKFDFTSAIFWWKASRILQELSSQHMNVLNGLLHSISKDLEASIAAHEVARERNIVFSRRLENFRLSQSRTLQTLDESRRALRIKMWYISDVRHSAAYEDALHVTRALRSMASSSRVKQPGSIATWARHRLRNSLGPDRSESQTLEILTAPKDQGGLSKLADEQIELTSRWLTRSSIENFCKGEERIHRFCFEVQKCVNKLAGVNLLESPVLWSSRLFEREKSMFNTRPSRQEPLYRSLVNDSSACNSERFISPQGLPPSWGSPAPLATTVPNSYMNSVNEIRSGPRTPVPVNFTDLVNHSRLKYSSGVTPIPYPLQTYQAATSLRSSNIYNTLSEETMSAKMEFTLQIKKILGSLITSDLGYLLWVHGSETDAWVNLYSSDEMPSRSENESNEIKSTSNECMLEQENLLDTPSLPKGDAYAEQRLALEIPLSKPLTASSSAPKNGLPQTSGYVPSKDESSFPFREAYKALLDRFSYTLSPYDKLNILSEFEGLVSSSLDEQPSAQPKAGLTGSSMNFDSVEPTPVGKRAMNIPRTKATSLEEVIANCTERRIGTLKLKPLTEGTLGSPLFGTNSPSIATTDSIVLALRDIFSDPSLRPATLFRDLQFIAAFVPSSILDYTSQGTAFWNAGLAALALKEELCTSMVKRATEITTYHINGPHSSPSVPSSLANTTLRDAAQLWLLAAKEGSPVAARELGLFYLTHPELLRRVTSPFSKAKDVFRTTLTGDRGVGSSGGKGGNYSGGAGGAGLGASTGGQQPGGLDAWTFAVVFHWMEVAANGGDRDASDFLRGNGELSGGR